MDEDDDEELEDDPVPPSDYGYDDEYAYLHICSTCFHLYETGRPDGMEQRCNCRPKQGERWPYHDFNERAILCQCCGLNVLRSGSRWSPFFCRGCQLLAMGVSVWNRHLVFPIGRHSLMHTWVPNTPSASLRDHHRPEELATGVYHALRGISRATDGLSQWYQMIMPRNLEHFGFVGDVSLREYIEAVAREDPSLHGRMEAFDGLCQLFRFGPPQTTSIKSMR